MSEENIILQTWWAQENMLVQSQTLGSFKIEIQVLSGKGILYVKYGDLDK